MKIYLSLIGRPETEKTLEVPFNLRNEINVLITVHLAFFLLYAIAWWIAFLYNPVESGTVTDFITNFIALPGNKSQASHWWSSIFTHQFVHFNPMELVLSMGMLWFFGHILQMLLGRRKVIMLYLISVILSAVAFILSHFVFTIFSGHGTVMEGAFAGALGVMTTTVVFFKSHQVRVFGKVFVPLWKIYTAVLVMSVAFIFKPSIAYALVYISSIAIGCQYAVNKLRRRRVERWRGERLKG